MTCITNSACEEDVRLENFVADLTSVVYSVFLQRGLSDSWLETELGVWKALKTAVQKWARQRPSAESSQELEAWRAGLWQDLAQCASHVAMANGVAGPRFDPEMCLYQLFASRPQSPQVLECALDAIQ